MIHFCLNLGYFAHKNFQIHVKFVDISNLFVSLIHIEYGFMCIVICMVSLKINDTEP